MACSNEAEPENAPPSIADAGEPPVGGGTDDPSTGGGTPSERGGSGGAAGAREGSSETDEATAGVAGVENAGGSGGSPETSGSVTIGPEGGVVASADGNARLEIPAGALAAPVAISIRRVEESIPGVLGSAYDVEPSGTHFETPAFLTLPTPEQDLLESSTATIATLEGTNWVPILSGYAPQRQLVGSLMHLSRYGVAVQTHEKACPCDTTCFRQVCESIQGTVVSAEANSCTCVSSDKAVPFDFFWSLDDSYEACSGRPYTTGQATSCIKKCARDSGGYVAYADEETASVNWDSGDYRAGLVCMQACKAPAKLCGESCYDSLLRDGDFEDNLGDWDNFGLDAASVVVDAYDGSHFLRMGPSASGRGHMDFYQVVIIPADAITLTLTGRYRVFPGQDANLDVAMAELHDLETDERLATLGSWSALTTVPGWRPFSRKAYVRALQGKTISLDLVSNSSSYFDFDALQLVTTHCETAR